MLITEALETLTCALNVPDPDISQDYYDALEMAVGALAVINEIRKLEGFRLFFKLPKETD